MRMWLGGLVSPSLNRRFVHRVFTNIRVLPRRVAAQHRVVFLKKVKAQHPTFLESKPLKHQEQQNEVACHSPREIRHTAMMCS